jgi:lipoic acid synthetase
VSRYADVAPARLPEWARKGGLLQPRARELRLLLRDGRLNTVCEEARCPNLGECFARGTATFMLAGDRCTRRCGYCSVATRKPLALDEGEPERVAEAAARLRLRYVVLTAVARDDVPDGGAGHFAACVRALRRRLPGARVEVLTPDFRGDLEALRRVLAAEPDVFNHNIETARRLFPSLRPQGDYRLSLDLLAAAKRLRPGQVTKSGLMVGLGESDDEVLEVLRDLRAARVDVVTIGQYLRPSREHAPVARYVPPAGFAAYEARARALGFPTVYSGVFVRSSFNAEELAQRHGKHEAAGPTGSAGPADNAAGGPGGVSAAGLDDASPW